MYIEPVENCQAFLPARLFLLSLRPVSMHSPYKSGAGQEQLCWSHCVGAKSSPPPSPPSLSVFVCLMPPGSSMQAMRRGNLFCSQEAGWSQVPACGKQGCLWPRFLLVVILDLPHRRNICKKILVDIYLGENRAFLFLLLSRAGLQCSGTLPLA